MIAATKDIKVGDRRFVLERRVRMVEAYPTSDDFRAYSLRWVTLASKDTLLHPNDVADEIAKVVKAP